MCIYTTAKAFDKDTLCSSFCVFKIPVGMWGDAEVLIHNAFLIKGSVLCIGNDDLSRLGEVGFCCCTDLGTFQCSVKLPLTVTIGNPYLIETFYSWWGEIPNFYSYCSIVFCC